MPIQNTGQNLRLRGNSGDGVTDINEEINSADPYTGEVKLSEVNAAIFTDITDGSVTTGRAMSEMQNQSLVAADPFYPTTEATGSLGDSLFIPQSSTISYLDRDTDLDLTGTTVTYSVWLKRNNITGTNQTIIASGVDQNNRVWLRFNTSSSVIDGKLQVVATTSSSTKIQLVYDYPFIDTSAWYHIIVAFDTTKDYQYDRVRVYANGIELTEIDGSVKTEIWPSKNDSLYFNHNQRIADVIWASGISNDMIFADFKFIDGQQLRPDSFGQMKNGIWVPKAFNTASTDTIVTSNRYIDFRPRNQSDISGSTITNNGTLSDGTLESGIDLLQNNSGILDVTTDEKISGSSWNLWSTSTDNTDSTVEAWINIDTAFSSGFATIVGANGGSSGEGPYRVILRGYGSNQYFIDQFRMFGSNNYYTNPDTYPRVTLLPNTWYHIVGTYTAGTNKILKAYLNGNLIYNDTASTISYSNSYASSDFAINQYRAGSPLGLDGKYGDIRVYSSALTDAEVLQNYNATKHYYAYGLNGFHLPLNNTSAGSIVSDTSLKLYLDASNSSSYGGSGTTWSDLSGNSNTATIYGSPNYLSTNGGYFDLDGSNDYIVFPGSTISHTSDQDFTIEAWLKFASVPTSGSHNFIGSTNSSNRSPVNAWFYGTGSGLAISLERYFNSTQYYSSGYNSNVIHPFVANKWYQIVITYNSNGKVVTIYVNGKKEDNSYTLNISNGSQGTTSYDMTIGNYGGTSFNNFDIAQFRIYNDILTAQEVIQNYRATQGNYEQVSTVDISGNANSFTATNLDYTDHIKDQPADNRVTFDPNNFWGTGSPTLEDGNKVYKSSSTAEGFVTTTMSLPRNSGKYYFEFKSLAGTGHGGFGITNSNNFAPANVGQANPLDAPEGFFISTRSDNLADIYKDSTYIQADAFPMALSGGVVAFAIDTDSDKYWTGYASGGSTTWWNSGDPVAGTNESASGLDYDHYMPFASNWSSGSGRYQNAQLLCDDDEIVGAAPTGYKLLKLSSLPNAQFDPKDSEQNKDYFKAVTYQGNGGTQGEEYGIVDGSKAGVFNGSSSYIRATGLGITGNAAFSVSTWINTTSSGIYFFFGDGNATGSLSTILNASFFINVNSNGTVTIGEMGFDVFTSTATVNDGNWHNIIFTSDGTNSTLYIDGAQSNTTTNTFNISTDMLEIGRATSSYYFNGKIDQVRVFNRELLTNNNGVNEISELYDEQDLTATTRSTTDIFSDGSGVALYELNGDALDTGGVSGKFGSGAIFNGSSSKIDLGTPLLPVSTFSVSMWFNTNNATSWTTLFSQYVLASGSNGRFICALNGNNIAVDIEGTTLTFTNYTISTNTWYHFVLVKNSSSNNYEAFINGSSIGTVSSSTNISSTSNTIFGFRDGGTSQYFDGKMDQVRIFNKALSTNNNGVNEINELYTESGADLSTTDILGDGSAVALYQLDGDATDTGGATGKFGSGAIFNGSSSYITLGATNQFASSTVSISFWVNPVSITTSQVLLGNGNGGSFAEGDNDIFLRSDGYIGYELGQSSSIYEAKYSTTTQLTANAWNHITLTYDSSLGTNITKVYVNGVQQSLSATYAPGGTFSGNIFIGTLDYHIGKRNLAGLFFNGKIDDVRIYSDILTQNEIGYIYNNTTGSIPTSNLVAYYKLDGNALDSVGSYNGTPTNITYKYDGTESNISYGYNGTASNVTYTQDKPYGNIDVGFAPDLVWIKNRSIAPDHVLFDSIRGAGYYIRSNTIDNQNTSFDATTLNSFDSNGFTISGATNTGSSGHNFVAWCWKAAGFKNDFNVIENGTLTTSNSNTTAGITAGSITNGWNVSANRDAGFSIVKYTGTASNATVGHGLSSSPEFWIIKNTDTTDYWVAGAESIGGGYYFDFHTDNQAYASGTPWNSTLPTSSVVSLGTYTGSNGSNNMIMYAWHSVDGFSKIGSYVGNGSSNGPFVYTGFKPTFVMCKRTDVADHWAVYDNARGVDNMIATQTNAVEYTGRTEMAFYSNGFKLTGGNAHVNANGGNYLYMAFAEDPFTTSNAVIDSGKKAIGDGNEFIEDGNYPEDNFSTTLYAGDSTNGRKIKTGFKPDLVWAKSRNIGTYDHGLFDSVRGGENYISSNLTWVENPASSTANFGNISSFDSDGFTIGTGSNVNHPFAVNNESGSNYVAWSWKAAGNENTFNILENGTITSTASAITAGLDQEAITPLAASINRDNGFSIIKWKGNGVGYTNPEGALVPHGLNNMPGIVILKDLDGVSDWMVHSYNLWTDPTDYYLKLNTSAAIANGTGNPYRVTSTAFANTNRNILNNEHIAYIWHSVPGFSKIGSYSGNGSSSGPTVYTGFQPAFLMVKRTDSAGNWWMIDNKRNPTNPTNYRLIANGYNEEVQYTPGNINILSDGFQLAGTSGEINASGTNNYIYMAFAHR